MSLVIGSWGIPATITLAAFVLAYACSPTPQHGSYYPDWGAGIVGCAYFLFALIGSLFAWLVWALLKG